MIQLISGSDKGMFLQHFYKDQYALQMTKETFYPKTTGHYSRFNAIQKF